MALHSRLNNTHLSKCIAKPCPVFVQRVEVHQKSTAQIYVDPKVLFNLYQKTTAPSKLIGNQTVKPWEIL